MVKGIFMIEEKRKRVKGILDAINKAEDSGGVDKEKLIAWCVIEWGNSRRKIQEYINDLKTAEMISEEEGLLWPKK